LYRYVVTERGKFLIAIIVIVFFVLPGVILVTWALSREAAQNDLPPDPNSMHQNGTGSTTSEPTPAGTPDPSPEPVDPSLSGPVDIDLDAGTMTFLFTPEVQTALDAATLSSISEFLTSPKNTSGTKIAVDIPQLPDSDTANLTNAVTSAFTAHEIPLSDIIFFVYQPDPDHKTFEVKISFQ